LGEKEMFVARSFPAASAACCLSTKSPTLSDVPDLRRERHVSGAGVSLA
jgi:hypothetical protein